MQPSAVIEAPTVFVAGPVAWNQLIYLRTLPRAESPMTFARRRHTTLGGTSAGKALNLARLGARVTLRTVVGVDTEADRVLALLRADGIEVIAEVDPDGRTEQHLNLMSDDGGRVSIYLEMPTLSAGRFDEQTQAAMAQADRVVVDLTEPSRQLLHSATALGAEIWCDVHDLDVHELQGRARDGRDPFALDFVHAASVLFLSSERLPDPRPFMQSRIDAGARLVVCTHGAAGATALTGHGQWFEVPAVPVPQVVDTNGAGDAFFAAFLLADLGHSPVPEALQRAAAHAARCVQSHELAPPRELT